MPGGIPERDHFYMRPDLVRNLGNMCNPHLHKGRLRVPKLIKKYIDEVSMQLKMVCNLDSEELVLEEKLVFMHETCTRRGTLLGGQHCS